MQRTVLLCSAQKSSTITSKAVTIFWLLPLASPTSTTPVLFRDATLYLVDVDGEPYVPMKPVVEGMGLSWQPQHEKLQSNQRLATCTTEIVMQLPGDDQRRKVTCFPLRKLPGWLMTIQPSRN